MNKYILTKYSIMNCKIIPIFFLLMLFSFLMRAQASSPALYFNNLDGNNVDALVSSAECMFWDLGNRKYEVPAGSGKHAIYASSIWMGGIDDNGYLKLAATTYRQSGKDFFTGYLKNDNSDYPYRVCGLDKVFKVSKSEIEDFKANDYNNPSGNIVNWPARNNPALIDLGIEMDHDLAPFFDANNDGNYNPYDGDYPLVKGDNNVWRVFNDWVDHTASGGGRIGMEIQSLGYNYTSDDYLNNTTFWDFELNYKGSETLHDFYFGFWVDVDLGYYADDVVGCYPEKNTGFVYNGDDFDDGGVYGYGEDVPALSLTFVEGLKNENNEEMGLSSFLYYFGEYGIRGTPNYAEDYYAYLKGEWKDGTPVCEGGYDYGAPSGFMFPDSPNEPDAWSECGLGLTPHDRRFLMANGPITLEPGSKHKITVGIVWGESDNFEYPCPDMHAWIDTYHDDMLDHITNVENELEVIASNSNIEKTELHIIPNPASDFITVETSLLTNNNFIGIYDVQGGEVFFAKHTQTNSMIDIQKLSNGIYFLKLYNEDRKLLADKKIVVLH